MKQSKYSANLLRMPLRQMALFIQSSLLQKVLNMALA